MSDECPDCHHEIQRTDRHCPHCGRPSRFPNVLDAGDHEERQALDRRHQAALQEADSRGYGTLIRKFEAEAGRSSAVIACSLLRVEHLATHDRALYTTYYNSLSDGVKLPNGEKWDKLRGATDTALFGDTNKDQIRFAALSLDGEGLGNYGECSLTARDDMIAHRASVFEENSVTFMIRHNIGIGETHDLPKGFRAPWSDRARLCTAKLAAAIHTVKTPGDFSKLLLNSGTTSDDDDFVEVHIWGPMTVRTFEKVIVRKNTSRSQKTILKALEQRLKKFGVSFQVI